MRFFEQLQYFTILDAIAVMVLFLSWVIIGLVIEYPPKRYPSTSQLMAEYRHKWMVQMITREPRIFDASILDSLRQGTAFFGSACLIAIGGGLAALSNTERLRVVAEDLALDAPAIYWEVKIMLALVLITNTFLKFIWANRLFGYCGVVMASVPNETDAPEALPRAYKAAELNIAAARAFNRGLRGVYFSLGALGWLIGPEALIVTTIATIFILLRREFASGSRRVIMMDESNYPKSSV